MSEVRDIRGDYIKALLEERDGCLRSGAQERANAVAIELRKMGHEVEKAPTGVKERAVPTEALETVVEADVPPKRRGRPAKPADK